MHLLDSQWRLKFFAIFFSMLSAVYSSGQVLDTLFDFDGPNGSRPYASFIQGFDGNLYGTTEKGGSGYGNVFKITRAGISSIYSFCGQSECEDGAYPVESLTLARDGKIYGTTQSGGANNAGSVFHLTGSGTLTTLYSFCARANCADGLNPSSLVEARDGNFYGTTFSGGIGNAGTVFKVTSAGRLTTLYNFCSHGDSCSNGSSPGAGLVEATSGNFYGTTEQGGANSDGTIFKITPKGELTTVHSFDLTDGTGSIAALIEGIDGDFYGTSQVGGAYGAGTIFKVTPGGELTTLYSFCSQGPPCLDGASPMGSLIQASDRTFYGTTVTGGISDVGSLFRITASGKLTTQSFGPYEGNYPYAGLMQATNGAFYGTTYAGGTGGDGTVFSLVTGLGPFVETQPRWGKEASQIGILGQGFTASSVVTFGGVRSENVRIEGPTALIATVPMGALSGPVTVITDNTQLTSNQPFRVTPQLLGFSPSQGSVGQLVTISGVGLSQTLRVGFGGNVPGTNLTIVSDREVTVDVPPGAKTGRITLATEGGIAYSSEAFTITP